MLSAVLAAALVSGVTGAAATRSTNVKRTNGWIEALAMDGPRAAYDVGAHGGHSACNRLFVWNVTTGSSARVSGKGTCDADSTSTGAGVRELAVAGTRVAWIVNLGGNTESDDYLYTASLPRPKERMLASAVRRGDVDGILQGTWLGGLVGSDVLLAVNSWSTDSKDAVSGASLRVIAPAGLTTIATGQAATLARSADLGRVAVLRPDGTVGIYAASGALLRAVSPASAKEVALRKDYLVVLTKTRTLELYNANIGAFIRKWPVPAGAENLDVHSGIAVYSLGRQVRALRLATGTDVVLTTAKRAIEEVEIEAPGVVYAFNTVKGTKDIGNVAFVPLSRVIAAVS
jgi:hypothetical protein